LATADQLKALIRSHADGDDESFYSIALQVAAGEARRGNATLAQTLKAMIDERRHRPDRARKPIPVASPRGDLASLLSASYPDVSVDDMVLNSEVRDQLQRVLIEQRQHDRLSRHGLRPARKLLLLGAPGTGKTLSAKMLATQLRLPLLAIRLDGLITKFLGETAAKLRLIFDAMSDVRGVYLFDEVDALAGERGRPNDVGEIRRVLNSFLQFLEEDESESLLVAASNHPSLLDRALFRRFDTVIRYPLPNAEVTRRLVEKRLNSVKVGPIGWSMVRRAATGLSHADIVNAADDAAKACVLRDTDVTTTDLTAALRARRTDLRRQ
jgi:SpoVK/Ycf46/Vps4 family AAA+-type ATPase